MIPDSIVEQLFDPQAAGDRFKESCRRVANPVLDCYASTVDRLADAQVSSAREANVPGLLEIAEQSAAMSRGMADAYVASIRELLDR
jgi:hypothetical protein